MKHSGPRGSTRAAVVVATITFTLIFGAGASVAGATPGNGNGAVNANPNSNAGGQGPHADDPTQVPSGSNGVNHNDPPLPANPDCTNTAGTSGTCDLPQPLSNADLNNTGANDTSSSNAYASTRNGADSDNGNGNGQAIGRPCAGCVGNADNKNPHGQAPNGPTDHNNGYECDGNNGIGQTNPAHTGCTGDSGPPTSGCDSSTTDCTPGCDVSTTDCSGGCDSALTDCSPPPCVSSSISNCSLDAGIGVPRDAPVSLPAEVLGETITAPPAAAPAPAAVLTETAQPVTGAVEVQVLGESLARTGVDVETLVLLACGLVSGGAGLAKSGRRRLRRS